MIFNQMMVLIVIEYPLLREPDTIEETVSLGSSFVILGRGHFMCVDLADINQRIEAFPPVRGKVQAVNEYVIRVSLIIDLVTRVISEHIGGVKEILSWNDQDIVAVLCHKSFLLSI